MSDIVERLRAVPNFNDGKLAHEAADELARLRAELERERARVDALSAIERALQHVAISLQEHFDGTGMEISSSYHHFVYLPNMIRKALAGSEQYALDENDRAALDRFMADQPKDRPDRVVEKLREITQACIALRNGIGRCYRMLQSEPDTKGALFKAENILRDLHTAAPVPAAVPPRCIWPDCGHDTNRVSDGGGCFGIGCPKPDTGQAAPVAQGVPEGIRAKPLVWEEGVPNRDGTICEWMAGMGFYVQLQPDEEPHLRYEANWGDIDTSSFPTLDEAKAWCQDEADAWVREWAMLSAAPQPPAAEGEI